ncbi:MAG: S41 family peptidase [Lachnospiraceae bacterium]|nr:S41 family peptidase [Lachnospiraceae bacterium]
MKEKNSFGYGILTGAAIAVAVIGLSFQALAIFVAAGRVYDTVWKNIIYNGIYYSEYDYDFEDDMAPEEDGNIASNDEIELFNIKLNKLAEIIFDKFLFEYDKSDLLDGMLKGYVKALNDPYSSYTTAEELKKLEQEEQENVFGGIGASIGIDSDTGFAVIVNIIPDSPAFKSGVKVGDVVYKVDGTDVTNLSLDEIVERVRGEVGSQVKIVFVRDGVSEELTITRETIHKQYVSYEIDDDKIGYIYLSEFSDEAAKQFEKGIRSLKAQGMKGLIIDLRYNGGGTVDSAIEMIDLFLEKDTVVTVMKDKNGNEETYKTSEDAFCKLPIVILVNGQTVSAAELFTGAMRDYELATIVGEKTFGKGIAQTSYYVYDSDDSVAGVVKLTTDYYYLPGGECIHGVGIEPDVPVQEDFSDEGEDAQLLAAIETLKKLVK